MILWDSPGNCNTWKLYNSTHERSIDCNLNSRIQKFFRNVLLLLNQNFYILKTSQNIMKYTNKLIKTRTGSTIASMGIQWRWLPIIFCFFLHEILNQFSSLYFIYPSTTKILNNLQVIFKISSSSLCVSCPFQSSFKNWLSKSVSRHHIQSLFVLLLQTPWWLDFDLFNSNE